MKRKVNHQQLFDTARCIRYILDIANAEQNSNDIPKLLYMRDTIRHAIRYYVIDGVDELLERVALWDRAHLLTVDIDDWDAICDLHFKYEESLYE